MCGAAVAGLACHFSEASLIVPKQLLHTLYLMIYDVLFYRDTGYFRKKV
jgi:hypothetical protein